MAKREKNRFNDDPLSEIKNTFFTTHEHPFPAPKLSEVEARTMPTSEPSDVEEKLVAPKPKASRAFVAPPASFEGGSYKPSFEERTERNLFYLTPGTHKSILLIAAARGRKISKLVDKIFQDYIQDPKQIQAVQDFSERDPEEYERILLGKKD